MLIRPLALRKYKLKSLFSIALQSPFQWITLSSNVLETKQFYTHFF